MLIDYQHVNVYQENTCVLKDVAFHVDEGEFVYIIGKVGSGKSSLLKTFYCELDLYKEKEKETKAEVLDRDLYKIKRKEVPSLRKEMGIIFQDFQLLHDRTIRKNLEFVLRATGWKNKKEIHERILSVLDQVGMADKQDKMPYQLSGGEQQRIVLARALLNAPPLILADEPTGNIDPETSVQLLRLLREISEAGTTVIIATHQYDLIEKFPGRLLRCEEGALIEVQPSPLPAAAEAPGQQPSETASPSDAPVAAPLPEEAPSPVQQEPEAPSADASRPASASITMDLELVD